MKYIIQKYQQNTPLNDDEKELLMAYLLQEQARQMQKKQLQKWLGEKKNSISSTLPSSSTPSQHQLIRLFPTIWWQVAALIVLLLGLLWWQPWQSTHNTTLQLADQYLNAQLLSSDILPVVRGGDPKQISNLEGQLKAYYESQQYPKAIDISNKLLLLSNNNTRYRYAKALCYIQMQQYPPAIGLLESIVSLTEPVTNDAKWVLALLYIKQSQYNKACPLLIELQKNGIQETQSLQKTLHCQN